MFTAIINCKTGRILREFAGTDAAENVRKAEDVLESLDYQAPRIAAFFDIWVLGASGWECPYAALPKFSATFLCHVTIKAD